jgi:NAD-dependent deacetylase
LSAKNNLDILNQLSKNSDLVSTTNNIYWNKLMDKIAVIAEWIQQSEYLVAFTGAGISTTSGIPDFRSPGSGLWENADPYDVASIFGFRRNPQAFYDWVRPLVRITNEAKPNPAHIALFDLERRGKLKAVITQNIDMLHTKAGNSTVYELHGHTRLATCIQCFSEFDGEPIFEKFLEDGKVPHCPKCNGVIKPNVILFGEQLPYEQLQAAKKASRATDLMLVVGSSLEVAPASDIPLLAKRNGAKVVIINLEPTPLDNQVDLVLKGDAAEILPAILQCMETMP